MINTIKIDNNYLNEDLKINEEKLNIKDIKKNIKLNNNQNIEFGY